MTHPHPHSPSLSLWFLIRTSLLSILGVLFLLQGAACTKQMPTKDVLGKHCINKFKAYFKRRPIGQLEQKFFTDRKNHNQLKEDQITLEQMVEINSSATISTFRLSFSFKDKKGKLIGLRNTPETGGVALYGPNKVSYKLGCRISWGLFKGKVIQEKLSVKQINMESWGREMKQMTTGMDLEEGESNLR